VRITRRVTARIVGLQRLPEGEKGGSVQALDAKGGRDSYDCLGKRKSRQDSSACNEKKDTSK